MTDEFDSLLEEAEEATKPTLDGVERASKLANEMLDLERQMDALTDQVNKLKARHTEIAEKDLPALFDEYRLESLTLQGGGKVELKTTYIGKIDPERAQEAYQWLADNGHGDLVKTAVEARFGMGEFEKAKQLANLLTQQGFIVNADQSVHYQALGKFVRTMMEADLPLPDELFHPNRLRRAKLTVKK